MMLSELIEAGIPPQIARQFSSPLKATMALNAIDTPEKKAAFIAQCCIESANFTRLEENLTYTTPERLMKVWPSRFKTIQQALPYTRNAKALANLVYANRNGNGDETSGDGWKYRGRGLFQLTGRANYKAASEGSGMGPVYVHKPELVAEPDDACLTACWFWRSRGCNELMAQDKFDDTTRLINGPAMLHAKERREKYHELLTVFS